ncbi:hypothetical protein [Bacillus gaemokensis]|uniref:DUF4177 domain-containing protein n=1 Tax=Bacillus gaemokensis TaxID=574375 RepID=A0A073K9E2_9BACI|nr:hypothetical protein [Bacillus gaemokensis]KEK23899.1 hypothetical protein BAGA_05525 [Bacillus gaemokensis]KYG38140.1 hypothetical protein AZF08_20545 [Bacillus gaemokensis]
METYEYAGIYLYHYEWFLITDERKDIERLGGKSEFMGVLNKLGREGWRLSIKVSDEHYVLIRKVMK